MKVKYKLNIKKDLHFFIFSQLNDLRHWELTPGDVKILSNLFNIDYDMKVSGEVKKYEDRMNLLFSQETKNRIMQDLNMSYNTFNNCLTRLRKKGWISKENTIDERFLFNLDLNTFQFTIEFENET